MNTKSIKYFFMAGIVSCCMSTALTACVDNDDDVPMSRYTAEKMTAAQFLEENEDRVGDFITLLKRTSYFSMLSTYGDYTVFAPNNEAIAKYMANRNIDTIDAGTPVLSMHAPYEVTSKFDCYMTYKGVKAVYEH